MPDPDKRATAAPPALQAYLRALYDDPSLAIVRHERLTGGAIQQNIALDLALAHGARHEALVLRTDAPSGVGVSRSREQEHALLAAAFDAGVTVPEPLHLCTDPSVTGRPFFLMQRVGGTANPVRLTRNETLDGDVGEALVRTLGGELARIHAIPLDDPRLAFLQRPAPHGAHRDEGTERHDGVGETDGEGSLGARIALYRRLLDELEARRPVLEWTLAWLERQRTAANATCLCHNDFRTGNLMIDVVENGERGADDGASGAVARITGVLDWEFAAPGDPHEDIGWFCAPCWRFAAREREAGGLGEREAFYAGYEALSGRRIDRAVVPVWEIVATLRWTVIALQQGARFTSGAEPTLELGLTGRMVAGLERDLLELVTRAAGSALPAFDHERDLPPLPDAPGGQALLVAARASLLEELLPHLPGERRYQTLMIANAMGMAARELARAEKTGAAHGRNAADTLCAGLRAGTVEGLFEPSLLAGLCAEVDARLAIADPGRSTRND